MKARSNLIDRSGRRATLFASASVAALLIGSGMASAASCTNPIAATFDNPTGHITANVCVLNTSFTGNITNEGTITPGGIAFENGTLTGSISSSGSIAGGLSFDSTSQVATAGISVLITGPIVGGISNAGTISGGNRAIVVTSVATFGSSSAGGGITNSGTISSSGNTVVVNNVGTFVGGIDNTTNGNIIAKTFGIVIGSTSSFGGGISNAGTISAGSSSVRVAGVSNFSGGITNSGTISAGTSGIIIVSDSTFTGGISNGGKITAGQLGMVADGLSTFSGGMTNSGTISAATGMRVFDVTTFNGGMTNTGTIVAGKTGMNAQNVSTFSGGMTNTGNISAGTSGMYAFQVSTFSGGLTNTGTISVTNVTAMFSIANSTFAGGITNSGLLIGGQGGISVNHNALYLGGITNGGTISGGVVGISTFDVTTFMGGITNFGTIMAGHAGISVSSGAQFGSISAGGGITNTGSISSGSVGILVNNINTYAGGVSNSGTISSATLGLSLNDIASFTGGVVNGPTGKISAGASNGISIISLSTFAGGISNGGTISAGNASIFISGVSNFSGGINNSATITGKTGIYVGSAVSNFTGAINNSGTITGTGGTAVDVSAVNNAVTIDQLAGGISGAIKLSFNADVLNVSGGTINGNIVGQALSDTINFALGAGTFTYGPSFGFSDIHQVNVNSGTVVLDGVNSATATAVNGGILAGTGTLASNVNVNGGGTLMPGLPTALGILNITGNLAFQSGASYLVEVNPASSSSTNVTGTATLAGTVQAMFQPGSYATRSYDILHSTGLLGTTFAGVTTNSPGFVANLSYTPTDVFLNVTALLGVNSAVTLNQNQQAVANSINTYFNNGGTLPAGFLGLFNLSGNNLASALSQISGEAATGAEQGVFQMGNHFLQTMLDPFTYGRSNGANGGALGNARERSDTASAIRYSPVKAPPRYQPFTSEPRWTMWGSAYGGYNRSNGDSLAGSHDLSSRVGGFAAGADYWATPDSMIGVAMAGGGTNWSLAQGLGGGKSDAFQAGFYGATRSGPAYVAASFEASNYWMSTNRISFAGDRLSAAFGAQSYGARMEGGYRYWMQPNFGLTPYGALQVQNFHTPRYSETELSGLGFGLNYNAMGATDSRSELGVRLDSRTILQNSILLTIRGRLAWAHDWVSKPVLSAIIQGLPGAGFLVNGAPLPKDSALASGEIELKLTPDWSLLTKFSGEYGPGSRTYASETMVRYSW